MVGIVQEAGEPGEAVTDEMADPLIASPGKGVLRGELGIDQGDGELKGESERDDPDPGRADADRPERHHRIDADDRRDRGEAHGKR